MSYVFQFGVVWDNWPRLIDGALATMRMTLLAIGTGLLIATGCAFLRELGVRALAIATRAYVEAIRNTPLLVQLFVLYFSLPPLGIRFSAEQAAVIGLALNFGGYATEILRSGIEAVPHGQREAARALGLARWPVFGRVVLPQAIRIAYPALAAQCVLVLLGSSIVSAISAVELTATVNTLQSTTFRSFEFYFVATGLYLAMAGGFRLLLDSAFWLAFERGRPAQGGAAR